MRQIGFRSFSFSGGYVFLFLCCSGLRLGEQAVFGEF